jgi:hypothetical protein
MLDADPAKQRCRKHGEHSEHENQPQSPHLFDAALQHETQVFNRLS